MQTGDFHEWPTVPGWVWLEEYGDPSGDVVPFVRLAYTRGIEAIELSLPHVGSLLLQWWSAIADKHAPTHRQTAWVPVWVWLEHGDQEVLTCVSLDRIG